MGEFNPSLGCRARRRPSREEELCLAESPLRDAGQGCVPLGADVAGWLDGKNEPVCWVGCREVVGDLREDTVGAPDVLLAHGIGEDGGCLCDGGSSVLPSPVTGMRRTRAAFAIFSIVDAVGSRRPFSIAAMFERWMPASAPSPRYKQGEAASFPSHASRHASEPDGRFTLAN